MRAREIMFCTVAEAVPKKPEKPLTPEQAQKRSEKQARVQQQVRDEGARHAAKLQDLQSRVP
jgi:hypothetical protein